MTEEQKLWLDKRQAEGYQAIGTVGGLSRYTNRGALCVDGSFRPVRRGMHLADIVARNKGSFGVGIRETVEPGKGLPDPRNDFGSRQAGR